MAATPKNTAKKIVKRAHKAKEYITRAKNASSTERHHKPIDIHQSDMEYKYGRDNYFEKSSKSEKKMAALLLRQEMKKKGSKRK